MSSKKERMADGREFPANLAKSRGKLKRTTKAALSLLVMLFLTVGAGRALAKDARATLRATSEGTELTLTLVNGDVVAGRLEEVGETSFALSVPLDREARRRTGGREMKRRISYEEVRTIEGEMRTTPEELTRALQRGRDVTVTLVSGDVVRGRVELFDGDRLQVERHTWRLSEGDVMTVETRVSDSLLNGALFGAAFGAAWGLSSVNGGNPDAVGYAPLALGIGAGIGAGLGVVFDAMRKETKIFQVGQAGSGGSLTISPLLNRDQRGVRVTLRF